ncbi:single-stranded DNA-binding protein [Mycoplasma sp. NEAQ87857]|uniref:single-stranded DNA-binding protein n=1 Tax=Mycoplasma sp. NEAQ87857 TaxID=2683967 RepID=UPI001318951D|nr:single-stranded DNA-binding protein [Mycoplasma sp. NEAQ87857]QGZ97214.1 single-stranded DNA-binding protein [Mycoplasma sp. NEAQ87857]
MLNNVTLIGRTTSNIRLNHTSSGIAYTRFSLAINRNSNNGNEITDFIEVVCWSSTAEFIARSVPKGTLLLVQGSLRSNSYTSKNNTPVNTINVNADTIRILESKQIVASRMENNPINDANFTNVNSFKKIDNYPYNNTASQPVNDFSSSTFVETQTVNIPEHSNNQTNVSTQEFTNPAPENKIEQDFADIFGDGEDIFKTEA